MPTRIAIIPARSGSTRIKNKNIKKFHGKPLISYCLSEIKKSKMFDKIHISTDSNKIANLENQHPQIQRHEPDALCPGFGAMKAVV